MAIDTYYPKGITQKDRSYLEMETVKFARKTRLGFEGIEDLALELTDVARRCLSSKPKGCKKDDWVSKAFNLIYDDDDCTRYTFNVTSYTWKICRGLVYALRKVDPDKGVSFEQIDKYIKENRIILGHIAYYTHNNGRELSYEETVEGFRGFVLGEKQKYAAGLSSHVEACYTTQLLKQQGLLSTYETERLLRNLMDERGSGDDANTPFLLENRIHTYCTVASEMGRHSFEALYAKILYYNSIFHDLEAPEVFGDTLDKMFEDKGGIDGVFKEISEGKKLEITPVVFERQFLRLALDMLRDIEKDELQKIKSEGFAAVYKKYPDLNIALQFQPW